MIYYTKDKMLPVAHVQLLARCDSTRTHLCACVLQWIKWAIDWVLRKSERLIISSIKTRKLRFLDQVMRQLLGKR